MGIEAAEELGDLQWAFAQPSIQTEYAIDGRADGFLKGFLISGRIYMPGGQRPWRTCFGLVHVLKMKKKLLM